MHITTDDVSSNPAQARLCSIQHYVIKFVRDFERWVVFTGYSVFSTNKTDRHDITEILLKVALNAITRSRIQYSFLKICFYNIHETNRSKYEKDLQVCVCL